MHGAPFTKKRWVSEEQGGLMNTAEGPLSERRLRTVRWKCPAGSWKGCELTHGKYVSEKRKGPRVHPQLVPVCLRKNWGLSTPSYTLPHLDVCSGSPKLEPKGHGDCGIPDTCPELPPRQLEKQVFQRVEGLGRVSMLQGFGKAIRMTSAHLCLGLFCLASVLYPQWGSQSLSTESQPEPQESLTLGGLGT